jgi:hypothetical protein
MKLQHVPASRGATWVRQGFRAFALRPLAFMALLFTYTFASLLLFQLPWIGLVALACPPLLALVFMIGTQLALNGSIPTPVLFAAPFRVSRAQTFSLVKLGVLFLLLSVGVVFLGHWADGGSLVRAMGLMSRDTPAAQQELAELFVSVRLQVGVLLRFGLIALLMVLFAHAAGLVHWGAHGTAKSLFFSTVAVWRNKAAFLVYAMTGFLVQMAFSMLTSLLFALAGPPVGSLVMLVTSVVLATVFCTSLFFTFVDSFEASITAPATES